MSYTEEIYERAEERFTSISAQLAWLKGFDKPSKNEYESDGIIVYNDLKNYDKLEIEIKSVSNSSQLKEKLTRIENLQTETLKDKAMGLYNEKVKSITSKEIETLQNDLRNAESVQEVDKIQRKLKILPTSIERDRVIESIKEEKEQVKVQERDLAEKLARDKEALQEQFKRSQLDEEARVEAEELLSKRSVAQLERFETERTQRAFAGLNLEEEM